MLRRVTTAGPPSPPASANRSLIVIGAAVVGLILVTVVVVLLAGDRAAREYPADSPQGTLQRYLAAFDDGDYEAAYAFFSDRVHEGMDLDQYERAIDSYGFHGREGPARRVLFDRVTGSDDRVQVHLVVEEFYGDGLGGNTYRSQRQVRLVRQAGGWRIDEPLVWLEPAPFIEKAQ